MYGSSKPGKTALVSKYIPYQKNILVSLSPRTNLLDIYLSILRQAGIRIETGQTETIGIEAQLGIGAKFKALIPIFGSTETLVDTELTSSIDKDREYEKIPFNFSFPQDISEILKKSWMNKFIIF